MPYATYRFNKIIAAETIRFIVTVAIVVYKGLKLVVYRMLTLNLTASYAMIQDNSFINAPSPMIVPASKFLLAVLNSQLADYYIRHLGVTRNGGYFEYKPMFVEKLPVPQSVDAKVVTDIESYVDSKNETAIDKAVYMFYGLTEEEILYINQKVR